MNELIPIKTMSSREIAELTGKEHKNVLADCDKLNETYRDLGLAEISAGVYYHPNTGNQQHREYLLTKMQSLDLMTGYRTDLRIKINRRWEELETVGAQPMYKLPQTFSEALRELADTTEENERLMIENREKDRKIEEQAPAVIFTDSVKASVNCITVSQLAKNICQNGVKIGEHRLYDWLVENKYLIRHQRWSKTKGRYISNYEAYQRYIEMGLFFENKTVVNTGDISFANRTNYITGKGQVYFMNKFLNNKQ